jgi:hypothetical protein
MSLYEQFHSDINKKHMYNIITEIMEKEKKINLKDNDENYNLFLESFSTVFEEYDADEIETMNKYLLEYNIKKFTEINIQPIIKDDFEKLLEEREKQDLILEPKNKNEDFDVKEINSDDKINMIINEIDKEVSVKLINNDDIKNDNDNDDIESNKLLHLNSSKRTNIHSSRYYYKIDLEKLNISSKDLISINKIVVPIEDNYIFSIPVFVLNIPELNVNVHMQQSEIIDGPHRKYGLYKAIEGNKIKIKKNVSRITVDIRDISEKKYNTFDILKINIVEFKNKRIYFTCSLIHKNDYQAGDYIKIINNNSHNNIFSIFQEPLKIKKIQDNILVCEYRGLNEIEDNVYTNIDMKIMNMSNQNIIYFN